MAGGRRRHGPRGVAVDSGVAIGRRARGEDRVRDGRAGGHVSPNPFYGRDALTRCAIISAWVLEVRSELAEKSRWLVNCTRHWKSAPTPSICVTLRVVYLCCLDFSELCATP